MKSYISKFSLAFTMFIVLTGCANMHNQAELQTTEAAAILDQWTGNNSEILIQAYKKLVIAKTLNPKYVQTYLEMARFYIMSHNLDEAEKSLQEALALDDKDPNVYVLFGHLYYLQNRFDKGLEALDKAEKIGTDNPWLFMNRADIYQKQGKTQEAVDLIEKAISSPKKTIKIERNAYNYLATYYWQKQNFDKANHYYDEQIRIEPNNPYSYGNKARFLACEHHFSEAQQMNDKAMSLSQYPFLLHTLAIQEWLEWSDLFNKNDSSALKAYEKAKANDIEEPISFIASSCGGYQTWYNFGQTASKAIKQGYDFNKQAIETFKIQANHPEQMQQYFESSQ